jgi:DEAD/DEAH box helicase domain-containing protein
MLQARFAEDMDVRVVAARSAQFAELPIGLDLAIVSALAARGLSQLWSHQGQAIEAFLQGSNVVVATGTASGKSLTYQIPIMQRILEAKGASPTAIYLSPTKALAHDQERALHNWGIKALRVCSYDGDSSSEERRWAREHANVLVTNPDMVHHGLLSVHESWQLFFRRLSVIVVDECHMYRGMFGAHVANILRRLIRIARLYGANPQIIMASATVASPAAHAQMLTGLDFVEITQDGSPKSELTIGLTLPEPSLGADIDGVPIRRSVVASCADVLADLVSGGVRTLTFVRARKAAETLALITREKLAEVDASLPSKVSSYRAGYLAEERREIERALRDGELLGVATTTALELGVDISGLDAVLVAGWPGTRASFWQQVGRAGRDGQNALAVLVASDNPLDTYLVTHPEAIYDKPLEATVCDPGNPNVLSNHLAVATSERFITEAELAAFGEVEQVRSLLDGLCATGLVRQRPNGWYWTGDGRASDLVDIRGSGQPPISIVERETGRLLGSVDAAAAHLQVHPGAVYTHLGQTWLIDELDLVNHLAFANEEEVDFTTYARDITSVDLVETNQTRAAGPYTLNFGVVDVTEQVVSFQRRRLKTGQILSDEELDLPPRTLRTQGVWWTAPIEIFNKFEIADIAGAAHAAEHASIGLLPLFATCDRWDIGGVSVAQHPDNGLCTVVVYDGYPGGAGFAKRGFEIAKDWLAATASVISECRCTDGCPTCVQSPKCGNNNAPLDKASALLLLNDLVAQL